MDVNKVSNDGMTPLSMLTTPAFMMVRGGQATRQMLRDAGAV